MSDGYVGLEVRPSVPTRLTQAEKMAVTEAAMRGGLFAAVEVILATRLAAARMAYINVLWNWHEVEPDHCGGECFTAAKINAALSVEAAA